MTNKTKYLLLISFAFIISALSCKTAAKIEAKNKGIATNYAFNNPMWLADICHREFPATEGTVVTHDYKEGKTDTTSNSDSKILFTEDMLNQVMSQVSADEGKRLRDSFSKHPIYINIPCPPSTHRTDTFYTDSSKTLLDRALIQTLNYQISGLQQDTAVAHQKANELNLKVKKLQVQRNWGIGILLGLLILAVVILYFKAKESLMKKAF